MTPGSVSWTSAGGSCTGCGGAGRDARMCAGRAHRIAHLTQSARLVHYISPRVEINGQRGVASAQ